MIKNINYINTTKLLILSWLILLLIGCASTKNQPDLIDVSNNPKMPVIIAGVDSMIEVQAKQKATRLFVELNKQKRADSLLTYGQDFLKITEELYEDISDKEEELEKAQKKAEDEKSTVDKSKPASLAEQRKQKLQLEQMTEDSLTTTLVKSLLEYFLDHCSVAFNEANEIDPFNLRSYQLLARGNWDKGLIFEDTTSYNKAVVALQQFLNHDKGYPFIYRELGRNHYQLEKWDLAYQNLKNAKDILMITAFFDNEKVDSTILKKYPFLGHVEPATYYDYVYDRARAEMKVYKADSARLSLREAYALADTQEDSTRIQRMALWINWDDGNIWASEMRDQINDSLRNKNYEWARDAYLKLIPKLRTKEARYNTIWRLARIEYHNLKEMEKAANRLYQVVLDLDTSITQPPKFSLDDEQEKQYRIEADSLYKLYSKDCGQMFYDIGVDYQRKGLFDQARSFFVKDTTIEWKGKAKTFLHLAQLSRTLNISSKDRKNLTFDQVKRIAHQNNMLAIKLLNRMLESKEDLERREIEFAYGQLIDLYKEVNPKKVPVIFREYQEFVETQKGKGGSD